MGIVVPETCWTSNKICNKNLCCIQLTFCFHIVQTKFWYSWEFIAIRFGAAIAQSVEGLATGWTVRGSHPGGDEIFRTRPDRPWGPPILLNNGSRVFPGGRAAGAWRIPPTPFSAEVKERVELYLYSISGPSWPVIGWPLPLRFCSQMCCLSMSCCETEWVCQLMQCCACTRKVSRLFVCIVTCHSVPHFCPQLQSDTHSVSGCTSWHTQWRHSLLMMGWSWHLQVDPKRRNKVRIEAVQHRICPSVSGTFRVLPLYKWHIPPHPPPQFLSLALQHSTHFPSPLIFHFPVWN